MSKRTQRSVIELGGEPRINFLPGEIQERKDARRRRRSLFMLVILVGVLCGIGYVYSAQYATDRQAALEAEQQLTLDLLNQQSEFVEARNLANQVTVVGKAITHVTRNEIKWRELILTLRDELPAGAELRQWSFSGPTSQVVADLSDDIFGFEIGGAVSLDIVADRVSTIGVAIDKLSQLPGVKVVNIVSTSLIDGGQGYGSVLTVIVSDELYEGRFSGGWQPGMTPIPEPTTPPSQVPDAEDQGDDGDANDESGEDGGGDQ